MKKQPGWKAGGKLLDKTVFGFFDNFSNVDGEVRIRGACDLIEFLHKDGCNTGSKKTGPSVNGTAVASSKTAEKAYTLKRLVRGVGSPSNASKTGYYTALVGFLQRASGQDDCPTITELFGLVKSELADSEHDPSESVDAKERNRFEVRLGKVLVCGAIIKAGLIEKASDSELQSVLSTLRAAMYKMLVPLVWTYLNEVAARISGAKFAKLFWPLFEPVLNVPKEQHTMDSVYFLVLLLDGPHREMVNKKYFVRNFGAPSLLHEKAFPYLGELLFGIESAMGINHPFFNCLLEKLLKMEAAVVGFWRNGIVPMLEKDDEERPKYRDIVLPQLVASWFIRLKDNSVVPELLCPGMMKIFFANLQQLGKFSEDVRSLYLEACKAIVETYPKLGDESVRLATYRCLTQAPSSILIEKYASCKLLQNLLATLSVTNLKMVAGELKAIVIDAERQVVERSYAAHMLQRLLTLKQLTATDETGSSRPDEWRANMVNFFFTLGVFYSANGVTVLKPSKHNAAAPQELASTARGLFFHSLEHRHANLAGEHDFLLSIVRRVQESLESHGGKSLRTVLSEEQKASWDRVYAKVTETSDVQSKKSSKKLPVAAEGQNKLEVVFHLLLMQMGLHLFSEMTDLAHSSIVELECVMKRLDVKSKQRRQRLSLGAEEAMEPEWIEVVVDLFLNLLSQNSLLLRKVIGHVFPHLSGAMTLAAFNQILSVVNLKDKTNPLAAQGDAEDDEEEDDEGESEDDNDDEEDTANDKNDNDDEDEEDEEDDDELMGDEEEEETISDKMRQAVQAALGGANPETDTESLDLDEIDEEQGRRLDEALAEAFRSFQNGRKQGGKQKPTKAELQMDTVLTHFRMRVFDLIDAYLKHAGPDMAICLELLVYVFEMLPVANREETKYGAILNRYRQIFAALTRIKQFRSVAPAVQLNQILRDLIDKVAKGAQFPERNQYLLKACQFIVLCSQLLEKHNDAPRTNGTAMANGTESESSLQVDKVFGKLLTEFLTHRHPPIAFNVFQNLFRMSWTGNWYLAVTLTSTGLQVNTIRGQRRTQALQLLRELLKNRRFINSDLPRAAPSLRTICIALTKYLADLEGTVANGDEGAGERTIGQSELYELLQVLLEIHSLLNSLRQSGQEEAKKKPMLRWERIGAQVQSLRRFNLNSQTMASYRQLCQRLQLTPIANGDVTVPKATKENGNSEKKQSKKENKKESKKLLTNGKEDADVEQQQEPRTVNGHGGDEEEPATEEQLKRKRKKKDQAEGPETSSKKEKRRRKEARLQVASQGMEAVSFV
ncbi:myb-binding protein 1A [Anopheles bellator]|uniref:myb-binding protein 1A n=1 Tax=Anopheles bellator TaxID=139047 RepID=UPI0026493B23|nr:myb-binding protein 1A [Anopheles bellator]